MQSRYSQLLAELRRGQAFLDTNWNVFITVNSGGARVALNEVTVELAGQAQSQSKHRTGRTGERRSEHKLARALRRQHIRPIVKVAKLTMPGIAQLDALRVPPEGSNNTELVTAALAIGDVVAPHYAELVAAGLPGDFLVGLRTAADVLLGAIAVKGGHFRQQVGCDGRDRQDRDQVTPSGDRGRCADARGGGRGRSDPQGVDEHRARDSACDEPRDAERGHGGSAGG